MACLAAVAVGSLGLTTETTLGIDLGTTFSVAATCASGIVTVVPLGGDAGFRKDGSKSSPSLTLPSVVYYPQDSDASVVVGEAAAAHRDTHPRRTVYDAKRLLGRRVDDPAVLDEKKYVSFRIVAGEGDPPLAAIRLDDDDEIERDDDIERDDEIERDDDANGVGSRSPSKEVRGSVKKPEDVGSEILKHLKTRAERSLPGPRRLLGFRFKSVTISVPVNFSKAQRAATIAAARAAGFAAARVLDEPVAAAIAHGLLETSADEDPRRSRLALVYDFGGGTLDVAVLRLEKETKTFLVMGAAGDDRLGGEDFDRALLERLVGELGKANVTLFGVGGEPEAALKERALRGVERAKRALSESNETKLRVFFETRSVGDEVANVATAVAFLPDAVDENPAGTSVGGAAAAAAARRRPRVDISLTRADFEIDAIVALLDRCVAPVREALARAGGVRPDEIDDVVLVGGSSRLDAVRSRLSEIFGTEKVTRFAKAAGEEKVTRGVDPETAVAIGAARSYAC